MSRASFPVIDPIELTRDLIRIPSVTPADEGAMDVLERHLTALGFTCRRLTFEGPGGTGDQARIENLYARRGTAGPNLCFAGHTDVVPVGDVAAPIIIGTTGTLTRSGYSTMSNAANNAKNAALASFSSRRILAGTRWVVIRATSTVPAAAITWPLSFTR